MNEEWNILDVWLEESKSLAGYSWINWINERLWKWLSELSIPGLKDNIFRTTCVGRSSGVSVKVKLSIAKDLGAPSSWSLGRTRSFDTRSTYSGQGPPQALASISFSFLFYPPYLRLFLYNTSFCSIQYIVLFTIYLELFESQKFSAGILKLLFL